MHPFRTSFWSTFHIMLFVAAFCSPMLHTAQSLRLPTTRACTILKLIAFIIVLTAVIGR